MKVMTEKIRCYRDRRPGKRAERHRARALVRCGPVFVLATVFACALLAGSAVLQAQSCTYVTPYFEGQGGFVVEPTTSGMPTITADGQTLGIGTDVSCMGSGRVLTCTVNVGAFKVSDCLNSTGDGPDECTLSFDGIESGGWYWINAWDIPADPNNPNSSPNIRDATAAPLICEDQLGGRPAALPVDVDQRSERAGTLFIHYGFPTYGDELIGIVPHLRAEPLMWVTAGVPVDPRGITAVNGELYIVDADTGRILVYDDRGNLDPARGFALGMAMNPQGLTRRVNDLYVVDDTTREVHSYDLMGGDPMLGFALQTDNAAPMGIAFYPADGVFFVVDRGGGVPPAPPSVYGYVADAADPRFDFELDPDNTRPEGITVDRAGVIYVVDGLEDRVFAYRRTGHGVAERVRDREFLLGPGSAAPGGITAGEMTGGSVTPFFVVGGAAPRLRVYSYEN